MTPSDTYMLGQEILSVSAVVLAGSYAVAFHRARTEVRRLNRWNKYWHGEAIALNRQLSEIRSARKASASHARRAQVAQNRARIAATTAALRGVGA